MEVPRALLVGLHVSDIEQNLNAGAVEKQNSTYSMEVEHRTVAKLPHFFYFMLYKLDIPMERGPYA